MFLTWKYHIFSRTESKIIPQGHLVDLVQREVKALLQSALDIALCVVRANPKVLEGLGAQLEGNMFNVTLVVKFLVFFSIAFFQLTSQGNDFALKINRRISFYF